MAFSLPIRSWRLIGSLLLLVGSVAVVPATAGLSPREQTLARAIGPRARQVLLAMKRRDAACLAGFVTPDKGVRFSPYAFVQVKSDRVLNRREVCRMFQDRKRYIWGTHDGSGEPIRLTPSGYFRQWVYSRDFLNAPQVSYNRPIARGNTPDNSREVYPGAIIVEYHFPGTPQQELDWQSLRLVFQKKATTWYLVGVIHASWTI